MRIAIHEAGSMLAQQVPPRSLFARNDAQAASSASAALLRTAAGDGAAHLHAHPALSVLEDQCREMGSCDSLLSSGPCVSAWKASLAPRLLRSSPRVASALTSRSGRKAAAETSNSVRRLMDEVRLRSAVLSMADGAEPPSFFGRQRDLRRHHQQQQHQHQHQQLQQQQQQQQQAQSTALRLEQQEEEDAAAEQLWESLEQSAFAVDEVGGDDNADWYEGDFKEDDEDGDEDEDEDEDEGEGEGEGDFEADFDADAEWGFGFSSSDNEAASAAAAAAAADVEEAARTGDILTSMGFPHSTVVSAVEQGGGSFELVINYIVDEGLYKGCGMWRSLQQMMRGTRYHEDDVRTALRVCQLANAEVVFEVLQSCHAEREAVAAEHMQAEIRRLREELRTTLADMGASKKKIKKAVGKSESIDSLEEMEEYVSTCVSKHKQILEWDNRVEEAVRRRRLMNMAADKEQASKREKEKERKKEEATKATRASAGPVVKRWGPWEAVRNGPSLTWTSTVTGEATWQDPRPLPSGWRMSCSNDMAFFLNDFEKKSVWEHPMDKDLREDVAVLVWDRWTGVTVRSGAVFWVDFATGEATKSDPRPLPHGWSSAFDPNSGRVYYMCHATQQTQWVHPSNVTAMVPCVRWEAWLCFPAASVFINSAHLYAVRSPDPRPLPPGWRQSTANGRTLFLNDAQKSTQWEHPMDAQV